MSRDKTAFLLCVGIGFIVLGVVLVCLLLTGCGSERPALREQCQVVERIYVPDGTNSRLVTSVGSDGELRVRPKTEYVERQYRLLLRCPGPRFIDLRVDINEFGLAYREGATVMVCHHDGLFRREGLCPAESETTEVRP